jgi:peptide/nickel transport system substrate-binding protein
MEKPAVFRASWVADYPDAQNYLSLFYSKNFTPNGPNYTHFKNEEFDRMYENAMTETNDSSRIELYEKNGCSRNERGAYHCIIL